MNNENSSSKPEKQAYYGVIYKIINIFNEKLYIGQTIQKLHRRFDQHKNAAKNGKETFLCAAIRKYGVDNFKIETIREYYNKKDLCEGEKYYIRKYKTNVIRYSKESNGYNMTDGGESFKIIIGEEHPQFTPINLDDLKYLISLGYSISEIKDEFNVGHTVIRNRINDLGFDNIFYARQDLGGLNEWQEERSRRMSKSASNKTISEKTRKKYGKLRKGSGNPRYIKIERKRIIDSIMSLGKNTKGKFTLIQIGKILGINKNTTMRKFKEILGIPFIEAKDNYFFKPRIKDLIRKGKNAEEIGISLGYGKKWAYKKIRTLWNISYKKAKRLFKIYPKYDKVLLESLISEGYSFVDIDKILILIIVLNHSLSDLTKILEIGHDQVYTIIRKILDFENLTKLRDFYGGAEIFEFLEKRRVKKITNANLKYNISKKKLMNLIQKGMNLNEIARKLDYSYSTIKGKFKSLLGMTYTKARDHYYLKPLLFRFVSNNLNKEEIASKINKTKKDVGSLLRRLFDTEDLNILKKNWNDSFNPR